MTYLFTSDRLGFRNWVTSDKKPFALMCKDKEVMEFFPSRLSTKKSDSLVDRLIKHYKDNGFTFYAVDLLETSEFIGMVNTSFEAYFTPCIEIGWRLKRESWGKGYATEGAQRCLEYGFNQLNFTEIISITPLDNKKSEKVMLKIGLQKEGIFEHPSLEDGHWLKKELLYKITRP